MVDVYMTPQDLFDETADAFNRRDFLTAARFVATPITIVIGERSLSIQDQATMSDVFRTYRENLDVEAFDHTACSVSYVSAEDNGQWQVFARWVNYNDRGAEISVYDTNYIVEDAGSGRLHCTTVEILDPVKQRLTHGLPLA
ncbi:hypothetical protein Jann_1697 [Jannaschia sp. CCS1]|nr:hypothetical protein Jann_1697 [Jannaschia sp. CCS1]